MLIELLADIAKMSLIITCGYVAMNVYARRVRSDWTERLTKRRVAILGILTLAVSAIKVIEDVVAKESGPVDEMVLWFIRDHMPSSLTGFFTLVTLSATAALLIARRHTEAMLLVASMITAPRVVNLAMAIGGHRGAIMP